MKRILSLMLMLLAVFCAAASADPMDRAERARIVPGLPDGMVAQCTITDGRIDILVDTGRTDWDRVATAARKSSSLVIHPGIERPTGMTMAAGYSDYYRRNGETQAQSDARIAQDLTGYHQNDRSRCVCSRMGWMIGRYDQGTGVFIPEEIPEATGAGFAVRWTDENGAFRTERVLITLRYTELTMVRVRQNLLDAKYIVANQPVFGKQYPESAVISRSITNGRIHYRFTNDAKNAEGFTLAAAPQWLHANTGWQAYLLANGKETWLALQEKGNVIYAAIPRRIGGPDRIEKSDWAIKWVDEGGETRAIFYLEAIFETGNPKLGVLYKESSVPVPQSALQWEMANPLDGLSASYNPATGEFHLAIDEARLPANGKTDLSLTNVTVSVQPPQNARTCTMYRIQGDVIYGSNVDAPTRMGVLEVVPGQRVYVPELTECIFFRKLSARQANGKLLSYFVSPAAYGEYGGTTIVLEWKDASNTRIGNLQHITLTTDAYNLISRVNPSLTKNPKAPVTEPTVQTATAGYFVETVEVPQVCENAKCYEITLLDANGSKVQPEEPALVYLPYPKGKTMEEWAAEDFAVYHKKHDGSVEEFSLRNGKLMRTPYGLCMEVSSFSPYLMSWTDTAPVQMITGDLPQTGDTSMLMLWVLLLLAAGIAGYVLIRKKSK